MTAQIHTLIGAYVLDAVDDDERLLIEQHITECDSCAQEARELRATAARLADFTIVEPPARLRDNVMAGIRRTRQLPPRTTVAIAAARPKPSRLWRRAFVTAAALLVVALGGSAITYVIMQEQLSEQRAEADQIDAILTAPDARFSASPAEGGGVVSVVSSHSHDQAVVILSGLAEISDGQAYQLWLVTDEEQHSAGVIEPGQNSGTHLVSGIGAAEILGVTSEPAGGSPTPTLPMVAGLELPA